MGCGWSTLGRRLVVIDFNLTRMKCATHYGPVDVPEDDVLRAQLSVQHISVGYLLRQTGWKATDEIVRCLLVQCDAPQRIPYGFVLTPGGDASPVALDSSATAGLIDMRRMVVVEQQTLTTDQSSGTITATYQRVSPSSCNDLAFTVNTHARSRVFPVHKFRRSASQILKQRTEEGVQSFYHWSAPPVKQVVVAAPRE
jgi:hypothetical protein